MGETVRKEGLDCQDRMESKVLRESMTASYDMLLEPSTQRRLKFLKGEINGG